MAPNTSLYICRGIPWNSDYSHVRLFASANAANTYIISKAAYTKTQYSYISKSKQIRVDGMADQYRDCNYIAWKNTGYSNKWFYGFITDVVYLADNTCLISFEYDIFQTWFYDTTVNPSYVEREHVNDDTIGANTVPENVVMGDPVNVASSNNYIPHKWYMYATQVFDEITQAGFAPIEPGATDNEVSGYYKIPLTSRAQASRLVDLYTRKGKLESLISMFALTDSSSASSSANYTIARPTAFGDYTPKNNKLLCYPYNYSTLVLAGSETPYRYEWFTDGVATFALKKPKYAGGSSYVFPVGYQKESSATNAFALENSVPTGAYPTASFGANAFQNYLVQYGPQLAVGLIGQVVNIGASAATGNVDEAISAGVAIGQDIMDLRTHSLNSQTVAGTQSVAQLAYDTQLIIRIVSKQILPEYARIIDEYFTAFGYKVCRIKAPNITGRPSWNYVKTIGAQVSGNIPEYAETALKAMLNNGVTFWHTNDVGNYSLNNSL
jgi:hypothetical protein